MTAGISPNTQAILLLTAPLIVGRGAPSQDLLSPSEYKRLVRRLLEIQRQPADFLSPDATEIMRACHSVINEERLSRLLGRGFLLSQAIERWQTRAIWVVSRADSRYPRHFKARLREDAPAVIYGCGDIGLLETGGIAVVGSRHVDDSLINYTMNIGRLAAQAGRTLVSGGAKGIDQAAMRGALDAGGKASGVLADSLEKAAMNRENRNMLIDGQLVLISPYDPSAGFNVGHAMQRNKLIYALAEASLVVNSDLNKGGTWAGAVEQLTKFRFVPVYVRSTGEPSSALDALQSKGALAWPNPQSVDEFEGVFKAKVLSPTSQQATLPLFSNIDEAVSPPATPKHSDIESLPDVVRGRSPSIALPPDDGPKAGAAFNTSLESDDKFNAPEANANKVRPPAEALFSAVREVILQLLTVPMKETEVATALEISNAQAKAWLQRLVDEEVLEKQKKPAGYSIRPTR